MLELRNGYSINKDTEEQHAINPHCETGMSGIKENWTHQMFIVIHSERAVAQKLYCR